ncbi:hypothetical protein JCM8115_004675 [Rhodotorula mucilaginosa]
MPRTTRKRQEAVPTAPTVPLTRAKRKAVQRKNPSTSTSTTRRRGRPPATTAPRKTAYKDKRGQTPALPTVEAGSDTETEEATEEETQRKVAATGGTESDKVIDSQVNDSSSSDDSEDATVVRNLLTPRKRQKRRRASSSDDEEDQDEGDVTARAGTVIPETDYEGPVFTSPQRSPRRAGQKTYGKQKRPDKGKGKAVDPSFSPSVAQGGPAEEEEAGESDRSADPDRREDEEVADQQQPVASTSRKPSQNKSSGNSRPKKRVAASASQKSPARRPASSSYHARNAPTKEQAQQQQDPASETDSASSEGEGRPPGQRTSPRRRFELAPSEDEATDDGEDETKTMYPPEMFQHRAFIEAEDGGRRRGWVADRFWVHDQWDSPGKREKVVAYIEENGGRVVKSMKKAQIAILPEWSFDEYKELYAEATAAGAFPIVYAWVKDCGRHSVKEGRAVRLSLSKYAAPKRGPRADGRSKRYLRLSYEETEKFARLYARWARKEISRGEMLERMQSQFFDGTKRTTIDGFDACLKENEQQIRSLAKRINREAIRQYTDSEADGDATDAAARTEDEAYEGMRRSRSQSRPRPSSSAAAARQREVDDDTDDADDVDDADAEAAQLEALTTLAAKHGRTPHLVKSIYLACAFDFESTRTVLDILKEFDLGTVGLSPDDSADSDEYQRAMQTARDQSLDRVEAIWSPSLDRKLLQRGANFDAKVARDKNIAIEMVRDRREALEVVQGTGFESWYPDEEGFERWRREVADGDEEEEEEEEEEESELEPLDGTAAAAA